MLGPNARNDHQIRSRTFPDCSHMITVKLVGVCWSIWTRFQDYKMIRMISMLSGIRPGRRRRRPKVHGMWKAGVWIQALIYVMGEAQAQSQPEALTS